jgi:hypothetical protein
LHFYLYFFLVLVSQQEVVKLSDFMTGSVGCLGYNSLEGQDFYTSFTHVAENEHTVQEIFYSSSHVPISETTKQILMAFGIVELN